MGDANAEEFGSPTSPSGFRALLKMDAYQHVVKGASYPAIVLSVGLNDPLVPSWQGAKFAARLQDSTSSDHPILLRIDAEAGHGVDTQTQAVASLADTYAFFFSQLGTERATADPTLRKDPGAADASFIPASRPASGGM